MNENDIIRMAQECQLIGMRPHLDGIYEEALERFAALVAAAERETCAQVCDRITWSNEGKFFATAIRQRKNIND
jgi:hypothetical protein